MTVGLADQGKFFRLEKYKSLNTKAARTAIDDQEFSWIENFIQLGDGNLRTVWGPSPPLYTVTVGRTITYFFPFNIANVFYHLVILDNGAGDIVNAMTGVVQHVWSSGTFTSPGATQWGSQYLLVIDPVKGYFIWDGTVSYFGTAGGSPNTTSLGPVVTVTAGGSGYTSGATASVSGGSGTGATFTVQVTNGIVIGVTITNAGTGYHAGDTVTMTIAPVGAGSGATATVVLMPTGIIGSDIEVFTSRVWIINKAFIQVSAPASVSDFASVDGGTSFQATDSVLRVAFTAFRQSSGFLYPIADSSIDVINNVQTSSGITTFNNINVDPQVGTVWRDSTAVYGRAIMLGSASGVYGLYGGAAEKVSSPLDGIFENLSAGFIPSAALSLIFNIKVYIILLKTTDPFGVTRPIMFAWDGKNFFALSQNNNNITYIATLNINATQQCWATDGATLFQCFTTPSTSLTKQFQGKLWQGSNFIFTKEAQRLAVEVQNNVSAPLTFNMTVDTDRGSLQVPFSSFGVLTFVNNTGGVIQFQNNSGGNIIFVVNGAPIIWQNINWSGKYMGISLNSTAADFTIVNINLMYIETTAY